MCGRVLALLALLLCAQALTRKSIGCGSKCGGTFDRGEAERPGLQNCSLNYYKQTVDHFSYALPTGGNYYFQQRYYVCDSYWIRNSTFTGPIFFYTGNEGDVTLYVNNTGLMWESAPEFGALLVFAEHRYYGESKPFGAETGDNMWYLSTEQALADYAELIFYLKSTMNAHDSPVIAFGGSYGGMLASWFRMKYPSAVDGSIAASAPIMAFFGENPPTDQYAFNNIVTRDATPYAGAAEECSSNIRKAWDIIFDWASTQQGRQNLQEAWNLCSPPSAAARGYDLAYWAESAMAYMAMGNYPYPSSYMTNGNGTLPAFPMRVGCDFLASSFPDTQQGEYALMQSLSKMTAIFYNATGTLSCFDINQSVNNETQYDGDAWDFQWCTELMMPQSQNGTTDMFFVDIFNAPAEISYCKSAYNVTSRPLWATIEWGAYNIHACSNIVFSNGDYDPWSGSGVTTSLSESLVAIVIKESAHHLDLFWSHPNDPESVRMARETERSYMHTWVNEARERNSKRHLAI